MDRLPQGYENRNDPGDVRSLFNPAPRRSPDDREDRRSAALARIALELSHRELAALVTRAGADDPDVVGALAWDGVDADDLRALLTGRLTSGRQLAALRDRARLVVVAETREQADNAIRQLRFDPDKVAIHVDAAAACRVFERFRDAGEDVELVFLGQAFR